jgi:uncharacterized HAD superfamily protein
MDTKDSSNIFKALKKYLEHKNSQKAFNPEVNELAEIFNLHYNLVEAINKVLEVNEEEFIKNELENVKNTLFINIEKIMLLLERLSNRRILLFVTSDTSKIRKISKNYNSDLNEIFELNNIKDIFPSTGKRVLLIPTKT